MSQLNSYIETEDQKQYRQDFVRSWLLHEFSDTPLYHSPSQKWTVGTTFLVCPFDGSPITNMQEVSACRAKKIHRRTQPRTFARAHTRCLIRASQALQSALCSLSAAEMTILEQNFPRSRTLESFRSKSSGMSRSSHRQWDPVFHELIKDILHRSLEEICSRSALGEQDDNTVRLFSVSSSGHTLITALGHVGRTS